MVPAILFIVLQLSFCFSETIAYEYSYYISSPNHYQTLSVRDGVILPNNPEIRRDGGFRRGRTGPGIISEPRRYPINGNTNPGFQEVPNQETDPWFYQAGRIPQTDLYPQPENRGFYPHPDPSSLYPQPNYRSNRPVSNYPYPENYPRAQEAPAIWRRASALKQEIDESGDGEGVEMTTQYPRNPIQKPCPFCGVSKVNPMDEIDSNGRNPDAEELDDNVKNKGKSPNVIVDRNVLAQPNVVVPLIPYYVI